MRTPRANAARGTVRVMVAPSRITLSYCSRDMSRLARCTSGRAIASLWGETHDVEAAVALADGAILCGRAEGSSTLVIPNAEPAVGRALAAGTRFFKEWRG